MKEKFDLFSFYKELTVLKQIVRKGWIDNGVSINGRTESDGEHIFSMTFVSMLVNDKKKLGLDMEKVLRLALLHEIGEIDAGDIAWYDTKISQKSKLEWDGVERVFSLLPDELRDKYFDLWKEFETQSSPEARFVKTMDKFDTLMQAKCYDKENGTHIYEKFLEHDKPWLEGFEDLLGE